MILIEKTIYPKLNNKLSKKDLISDYSIASEEMNMAQSVLKSGNKLLTFMVY